MRNRRAQSTIEYGVLICIVTAALIAMQAYIKRGMQGRMRSYADEISGGGAYSPGATNSRSIVTRETTEVSNPSPEGGSENHTETVSTLNMTQQTMTGSFEETLPLGDEPGR